MATTFQLQKTKAGDKICIHCIIQNDARTFDAPTLEAAGYSLVEGISNRWVAKCFTPADVDRARAIVTPRIDKSIAITADGVATLK